MQQPTLSQFAMGLTGETAFDVLAIAKKLKAGGKDVIELQIGDSPFNSTKSALEKGVQAIHSGATHYCPSPGLPSFRETIARNYTQEFGVPVGPENVVVAPGAKVFEQFFCEAFLNPGDACLVFSPQFPTYRPNLERRGAKIVISPLRQENQFRPSLTDIENFIRNEPRAKAIFLNSPHNPTGGVATREDMQGLAKLVLGKDIAILSDEPYCHMVWKGKHETPLSIPGMLAHTVAVYTFSKSYSMSGWRLGYSISSPKVAEIMGKMINTSLSCVPPIVQLAGQAALENDAAERDEVMQRFHKKVEMLVEHLKKVAGVKVFKPAGTFYVFPDVSEICARLKIASHGLAMYLLEGADDKKGVACLGGECFGEAGKGFLRFSCAEPDERLIEAVEFFAQAVHKTERVEKFLQGNPKYRAS
ncbi:MAG: aminotransferase class I/II-fold pyridoxal phosphate-dependent enzyme [Gemmataceae bacterium]|nr:aminotransferase class I/II-fold pyridoxal phosphate-dependent enzyme [Gemmataceae bacterium]